MVARLTMHNLVHEVGYLMGDGVFHLFPVHVHDLGVELKVEPQIIHTLIFLTPQRPRSSVGVGEHYRDIAEFQIETLERLGSHFPYDFNHLHQFSLPGMKVYYTTLSKYLSHVILSVLVYAHYRAGGSESQVLFTVYVTLDIL